jgi:hypothetical protein
MRFERGRTPAESMNIGEISGAEEVHCIDITYRAYYEKKVDKKKQRPSNWGEWPDEFIRNNSPYADHWYTEGAISIIDEYLEWSLSQIKDGNWKEFREKTNQFCQKAEEYNTHKEARARILAKEYRKLRKKHGKVIHIDIKSSVVQVSAGEVAANMPLSHLSANSVKCNGKLYVMPDFFEKNSENIFLSR